MPNSDLGKLDEEAQDFTCKPKQYLPKRLTYKWVAKEETVDQGCGRLWTIELIFHGEPSNSKVKI
jgi:hypothetical protein